MRPFFLDFFIKFFNSFWKNWRFHQQKWVLQGSFWKKQSQFLCYFGFLSNKTVFFIKIQILLPFFLLFSKLFLNFSMKIDQFSTEIEIERWDSFKYSFGVLRFLWEFFNFLDKILQWHKRCSSKLVLDGTSFLSFISFAFFVEFFQNQVVFVNKSFWNTFLLFFKTKKSHNLALNGLLSLIRAKKVLKTPCVFNSVSLCWILFQLPFLWVI